MVCGLIWLTTEKYGGMEGFCEGCNEISGFIKVGILFSSWENLDPLRKIPFQVTESVKNHHVHPCLVQQYCNRWPHMHEALTLMTVTTRRNMTARSLVEICRRFEGYC